MDDWEFVNMLKTFNEHAHWNEGSGKNVRYLNEPGQLWFAYPWTLAVGQGGEGTFPDTDANADPATFCDRLAAARGLSEQEAAANKDRFLRLNTLSLREASFYMAQLCGVSCWHESDDEDEGMWDCVENSNGVAVKTTVGAMEHALAWAHNTPVRYALPSVCAVGYVDHSKDFIEHDGFRSLLAIVGETWEEEQEVRYVAKSHRFRSLPAIDKRAVSIMEATELSQYRLSESELTTHFAAVAREAKAEYEELRSTGEKGFRLPIALEGLIDEIVISPDAGVDYLQEVRSLLMKVGLSDVRVTESAWKGAS